jgi:putative phosphoesterase
MKIGILSDTHNNKSTTLAALDAFRQAGITRLFHCGDITTEATLGLFEGWDITFVWGNGDLEKPSLEAAARALGLALPTAQAQVVIDGYAIAVLHGHENRSGVIRSGNYRYVFHGHTHERRDEWVGPTRVINPGALGGTRRESRSVAILDVAADDLRFIEIEG